RSPREATTSARIESSSRPSSSTCSGVRWAYSCTSEMAITLSLVAPGLPQHLQRPVNPLTVSADRGDHQLIGPGAVGKALAILAGIGAGADRRARRPGE